MKNIYYLLLLTFSFYTSFSQSDNCSSATLLTSSGSCSPLTGTSAGATMSTFGCVGNADDDVWYRFVASSTSHSITVVGSSGYDAVVELFSGSCGSLVSRVCMDNTFSGQTESIFATGLTIGSTYYIRVFDYNSGSGSGVFSICLTVPPTPPANDNCAGATNLTANISCLTTSGTSNGATQSMVGCAGTADDDVWYKFTANSFTQTINVTGSASMDAVVELFSGTCGSLSSIDCQDNTFSGGMETINAVGLTPGQVYYVRIYDYYGGSGHSFSVCVIGNPIGTTAPNDNPCTAIQLPPVTSSCNYLTFVTNGATNTGTGLAPAPTSCSGGTGAYTSTDKDVWFKIIVPASGKLCITPEPNLTTAGYLTNPAMALYTGSSCSSLTQYTCSNNYNGTAPNSYPGTSNDLLPYINTSGLTPGSTVYLRYWGTAATEGIFGICVQAPTNDDCANAIYVCDINGYSASTSGAFTPDRPGTGASQMKGNNETSAGINQPNGTNTGGVFGYYPPSNVAGPYSSPAIDVNIENNSWIRFTAASATANLRVTVGDCWVGNFPSGGIQMQIFSSTGCTNFSPKSSFRESSTTFTVTGSGLTPGSDYYLMVDGYAGDICNYTIQALDGVAFPDITASPDSICIGQTSILTAPNGASSYLWLPGAQTTRTISVTPGSTQTFTCIVGGLCGYKQTLTKTIYMKTTPTVLINLGLPLSTCGTQTTTLIGTGATTYTWSTGSTTSTISVSPTTTTSYTLRGTAANTCTSSAVATISVNAVPNITIAGTGTICSGASTTLTASGGTSYTWSPGGATTPSIVRAPTITTTYSVTGRNSVGCTKTTTTTVTVRALPTLANTPSVTPSNCSTATGAITNVNVSGTPAFSYTWTNGSGTNVGYTPNITAQPAGNYNLTVVDGNGCSRIFGPYNIFNPGAPAAPTASAAATSICEGQNINLFANSSSGGSYTWTGPGSYTTNVQNPVITNATTTMSGVYSVIVTSAGCSSPARNVTVTVNPLPVPSATASQSLFCVGNTVNLNGNGGGTYAWTGPNGFSSALQNPSITNSQVNTSGIYTLKVTSSVGSCTAATTVSVSVISTPTLISASNDSTCFGGSLTLTANFGAGIPVNWYNDAALTNTVEINSNTHTPPISADGVYTYYAQGYVNGCATSVATVVAVYHNINAVASANVYTGNAPLNVAFTGSNSIGVTSTDNFTWNFGNNTTSNIINPSHLFAEDGNYNVILTVTDIESGCKDTALVTIKVNGELIVVVPNVFTPNGDGSNDGFHIDIKGAKSAEGYIYNRWGQLLYSWDALNVSWDGKANSGEDCPDATYYYLIKVIDKKNKEHLFPGYVLIIR